MKPGQPAGNEGAGCGKRRRTLSRSTTSVPRDSAIEREELVFGDDVVFDHDTFSIGLPVVAASCARAWPCSAFSQPASTNMSATCFGSMPNQRPSSWW